MDGSGMFGREFRSARYTQPLRIQAGYSILTGSVHLVDILFELKLPKIISQGLRILTKDTYVSFSRRPKLKRPEAVYNFVRRAGFEPAKADANRFTVCPR